MNHHISLIATAATLGFAYTAVPGAVNTEAMRRALKQGARDGWLVQFGSLLGDLLWAIAGVTAAAVVLDRDSIAGTLGLIGGGFLLLLAKSALHAAIRGAHRSGPGVDGASLKVGITFGIANPAGIAFWSGLGAGTLDRSDGAGIVPIAVLIGGFCLGALVWGGGMVLVIGYGRRFVAESVCRWIDAAYAVILSWFGVRLLWTSIRRGWRLASPALRAWG